MNNTQKTLYSSHIFMFPFRFDYNSNGFAHEFDFYRTKNIESRLRLDTLNSMLVSEGWVYEEFDISRSDEKHILYSEFAYFYDYARESIYNRYHFSSESIANFYRKPLLEGGTYTIKISETTHRKKKEYHLDISGVSLRIFSTGVGILSIELDNRTYEDFDAILDINDFGRRIYPGFVGKEGIKDTKNAFLAQSITITDAQKLKLIEEEFDDYPLDDVYVGKHIMHLLGQKTFSQKKSGHDGTYYIQPSLDDRMFVLSWHGNDKMVEELQSFERYYTNNPNWYKYIFVDTGLLTVQNENMRERLLNEATYDRWSDYGTFTGISRYSFVILSSSEETLKENNAEFIIGHSKSMYFQMMTILLAIRTSILRFSDELAPVATPEHIGKLKTLYEKYLSFYNRLYFKEVTHQEQGIELYDIALKQMKIPEHMEKLDGKFTKLHDFASLQADKKSTKAMNRLTILGAVLMIPGLVVSLLQLDEIHNLVTQSNVMPLVIGSFILGALIAFILSNKGGNDE
jgi:Mg2+ and Co2+ transporter CorA